MRKNENTRNMEVTCNCCGKNINVQNGIVMEGVFSVQTAWGYFSEKDGEIHKFDICEACYEKWIAQFKIPIDIVSKNEML